MLCPIFRQSKVFREYQHTSANNGTKNQEFACSISEILILESDLFRPQTHADWRRRIAGRPGQLFAVMPFGQILNDAYIGSFASYF